MAERLGNELETVAELVAKPHLLLVASENHVFRFARRHDGPVGYLAGVMGGVWYVASLFRRTIRSPDAREEAQQLYQQALAVDRDRARADLLAVDDRLTLLAASDMPDRPTLIVSTARHLVRWVAAARPIDDESQAVERAFARWCQAVQAGATYAELASALESYVSSWAGRPLARASRSVGSSPVTNIREPSNASGCARRRGPRSWLTGGRAGRRRRSAAR